MPWRKFNATTPAAPVDGRNVHFREEQGHAGTFADPIPTSGHLVIDDLLEGRSYDVVCNLTGAPPDSSTMILIVFTRNVDFLANWDGAYGAALTNPTATATFTIKRNGSTVGTVEVGTGGAFTFATSGGTPVSFAPGDVMTLLTPAQDATLADFSFTLPGEREAGS